MAHKTEISDTVYGGNELIFSFMRFRQREIQFIQEQGKNNYLLHAATIDIFLLDGQRRL